MRLLPFLALALLMAVLAAPAGAQSADAPTVTALAITSSPASGGIYHAGETIQVTATFSEAVTVTGVPNLQLDVGGTTREAAYTSGSGSTKIVFEYTVAARDRDGNGIGILPNPIVKPSSDVTIQSAGGADANTNHLPVADQTAHKVEGFWVKTLAVTSTPASGDTYGKGEEVQVTATFSEAVTVTGVPFLRLTVGNSIVPADYASGSGSAAIVFEYTVTAGDRDTDGVSMPQNPIVKWGTAGAATIQGADKTDANPNHAGLSDQSGHKVDGSALPAATPGAGPTVTGMRIASTPASGDTYGGGEKIEIEVSWSAAVHGFGDPEPTLNLTIGASTVQADFVENVDDKTTFSYTVVGGDSDTDGVSIPADPINLSDRSFIRGADNKNAVLTYAGLDDQSGHKVAVGGL